MAGVGVAGAGVAGEGALDGTHTHYSTVGTNRPCPSGQIYCTYSESVQYSIWFKNYLVQLKVIHVFKMIHLVAGAT